MIILRRSKDRGHAHHGWLEAYHTFSFADYRDPAHVHFRVLRVINEDRVQPGQVFPPHPHQDMETVTYIIDGALEHKDSMGTGSVIKRGDLQYMSAGAGVTHSEFNHSKSELVHLLQIWIFPSVKGAPPRYDQKHFPDHEKKDQLRLVVSPDGANGSLAMRQDARIYASVLAAGSSVTHILAKGRHVWLHVVKGHVHAGGHALSTGDAIGVSDEVKVEIQGGEGGGEILLFDLP